jgi:hypothetical protein
MVEFKTQPGNARLMRKNMEIVLIHSLLNVCDETIYSYSPSYKQKRIRDLRRVHF